MMLRHAALALLLSATWFVTFAAAQSSTSSVASASTAGLTTTTYPTATILFVGSARGSWAASLVHAGGCSNTYSLACLANSLCGQYTISITQGNSDYVFQIQTHSGGATYHASQSCTVTGFGEAHCTETTSLTESGTSTTAATAYNATGTQLAFVEAAITAGGTSTVDVNTCSATASPSAVTNTSGGSGTSKAVAVGVGVGVGVGGTLIIVAIVVGALFYRRRRRQRKAKPVDAAETVGEKRQPETSGDVTTPLAEVPGDTRGPAELQSEAARAELGEDEKLAELENKESPQNSALPQSPQELPGDAPRFGQ